MAGAGNVDRVPTIRQLCCSEITFKAQHTSWGLLYFFIFISITDINECDDGIYDCLRRLAFCKNILGSFNCSCNNGYIGDGKTYCTEAPGKIIDNFTLFAFCFTEVAIGFVFL